MEMAAKNIIKKRKIKEKRTAAKNTITTKSVPIDKTGGLGEI